MGVGLKPVFNAQLVKDTIFRDHGHVSVDNVIFTENKRYE